MSFALVIIFVVGLILRLLNFQDNFFFGYDQGRDIQRIYEIIFERDIKIVGPETDIPGIFNGPLLYYLLLPGYFLTQFNPNSAVLVLIFVNMLGVAFTYLAGKVLFNNKVGLLAAFLWSISYLQVNYARYISNTGMMPVFSTLFFLGLALYIFKKKEIGLPLSVAGLALSTHVAFYFVYLILFYLLYVKNVKRQTLIMSILTGIALLSPFILAELKFKFLGIRSLLHYFTEQGKPTSIPDNLSHYIQSFSESIYHSFFSFNLFFALLIFVGVVVYFYKTNKNKNVSRFLLIWIFSTLPLFAFKSGVHNGASIHSSMLGGATILFASVIYQLFITKNKSLSALLLVVIISSNLFLFAKENFASMKLFAYQRMSYKQQKELIDYTYKSSGGKQFSVCALSNPLFINTTWSALYKFYGEKKYGRLPYWSGQRQDHQRNFLPYDGEHVQTRYLIIEPLSGIEKAAKQATVYLEDKVSALEEEKTFGELIVQKRTLSNNTPFKDTQRLNPAEVETVTYISDLDHRYSCHTTY